MEVYKIIKEYEINKYKSDWKWLILLSDEDSKNYFVEYYTNSGLRTKTALTTLPSAQGSYDSLLKRIEK